MLPVDVCIMTAGHCGSGPRSSVLGPRFWFQPRTADRGPRTKWLRLLRSGRRPGGRRGRHLAGLVLVEECLHLAFAAELGGGLRTARLAHLVSEVRGDGED